MTSVTEFPVDVEAQVTNIQRYRVYGPQDDREKSLAVLSHLGCRIIRDGPYTDTAIMPGTDTTRFLIVAERAATVEELDLPEVATPLAEIQAERPADTSPGEDEDEGEELDLVEDAPADDLDDEL